MEVKQGFVADSANLSQEGKLNVLGVFEVIFSDTWPAAHPQLSVVLGFEVRGADAGQIKQLGLRMLSQDGVAIGPKLKFELAIPPAPLNRSVIWQVVNLQNLQFPSEGIYEFSVSVDGHQGFSIPVELRNIVANV